MSQNLKVAKNASKKTPVIEEMSSDDEESVEGQYFDLMKQENLVETFGQISPSARMPQTHFPANFKNDDKSDHHSEMSDVGATPQLGEQILTPQQCSEDIIS